MIHFDTKVWFIFELQNFPVSLSKDFFTMSKKEERKLIPIKKFLELYTEWSPQAVNYQIKSAKRKKIRFATEHETTFVELIDGDPFVKTI